MNNKISIDHSKLPEDMSKDELRDLIRSEINRVKFHLRELRHFIHPMIVGGNIEVAKDNIKKALYPMENELAQLEKELKLWESPLDF